jgi:prepilin-type N-terminal cleavage/methylation domain-containing protein
MKPTQRIQPSAQDRTGFTLIELMIVVGVVLTVATMTLVAVNYSNSSDRIRAAGRQMQSFFAGARDRAIYAKEERGVRLILDPSNRHTVVAIQYVGAPEQYSDGSVTFNPVVTSDSTGSTIAGYNTNWSNLESKGFLAIGSQIEIPRRSGNWFTVVSSVGNPGGNPETLSLGRPHRNFAGSAVNLPYSLGLRPTTLPGSEPVQLPSGVVIDLDGSQIPASWRPNSMDSTLPYSGFMDIMFSPRGTVTGDVAALGLLHLHVADLGDVEQWREVPGRIVKVSPTSMEWSPPVVPANDATPTPTPLVKRDQLLVTVNSRTGNVSVHRVNPTNLNGDQQADDAYRFAETGEVANQ